MNLPRWVGEKLHRKIVAATATGLFLASLVFLVLFVAVYRGNLIDERANTARQINRFLQISLENAMLKRDLAGLQTIVERLGAEKNIASVAILNPQGEVRFTSDAGQLGQILPVTPGETFITDADASDILRSVIPVSNRKPCQTCHGPVAENPVNGILVIDYRASAIRQEAVRTALAFSSAGLGVALIAALGSWLALQRWVLRPVSRLKSASDRLALGDLSSRSRHVSDDELGALGQSFDKMASRLQEAMIQRAANEAFQQAMIDAIPDAVRVIGPDYRILKANKAFFELHGGTSDTVVGKPCYAASHHRCSPCPAIMEICPIELSRTNKLHTPVSFRARHQRANGESCLVEVRTARIKIPTGDSTDWGIVESIRDLDADIQASHEQKLAELSMLAAGVAHEIRNPLGGVSFALSEAEAACVNGQSENAREYIGVAQNQIDSCISVTSSLLKLSTPATDALELVDVGGTIAETLRLIAPEAEKANVRIKLDLPPGLRAEVSDGELRRIVINLSQNAFHAMPGGGDLNVTARNIDDDIQIDFVDTGDGVPPEDLQMIFQPFWSKRADGSRGTGLGLTLTKTAVESWGGRIAVENRPQFGVCFTVWLPCADAGVAYHDAET